MVLFEFEVGFILIISYIVKIEGFIFIISYIDNPKIGKTGKPWKQNSNLILQTKIF